MSAKPPQAYLATSLPQCQVLLKQVEDFVRASPGQESERSRARAILGITTAQYGLSQMVKTAKAKE